MKKLIAIFAVLLLAAPAMAADWSFYGSQRMATFYVYDDFGDFEQPTTGEKDDWGLQWDFQANSRLGARVKADKVTGHIELGLKGTDGGDTRRRHPPRLRHLEVLGQRRPEGRQGLLPRHPVHLRPGLRR